jgi:non-canonical purine NTP pyrophosphatase (RdgB/HAM1 family)
MSEAITFITGNPHKAEQLAEHLGFPVTNQSIDVPEIQSPTLDPAEVVTAKAEAAFKILGRPALVEDTSIRFKALGRLPGPYIKAFLTELGPDGICRLLDSFDTREAVVTTQFALGDKAGVKLFVANMACTVSEAPRGDAGIGTDSILIPEGWTKTWGEMTKEEQAQSSVRLQAIAKLREYLTGIQK